MQMIYWLRVRWKLLLRRFILLDAFCKHCGRTVHDFQAPDAMWDRLTIRNGNVLCYDCFCEACQVAGLPTVWRLA